MTIIEPKKNKIKANFFWLTALGLILIEALFSIIAYSQNVRFLHDLKEQSKNIEDLRIAISGFKNDLYAKLDLQNVDQLAAKLGLVKEKKPDYLSVNR